MATIRTMSVPAISRFDRGTVRKGHAKRPLLIAAALFLAVLIADLALIEAAAPSLADLGSLYVNSF